MKPLPPRLPARGRVIARENPTATAASMALPPIFNISTPISEEARLCDTTIPEFPIVGWKDVG